MSSAAFGPCGVLDLTLISMDCQFDFFYKKIGSFKDRKKVKKRKDSKNFVHKKVPWNYK